VEIERALAAKATKEEKDAEDEAVLEEADGGEQQGFIV